MASQKAGQTQKSRGADACLMQDSQAARFGVREGREGHHGRGSSGR